MTKLKHYQFRLKNSISLLWIVAFMLSAFPTDTHAVNETAEYDAIQTTTVTGTVVSADDNMGIPGVNVLIKGTTTGTVTDFDGNYSINAPSGTTLVYSYIGYTSQEIVIGNQTTINVTLQPDLAQLDEVVVVGYGTAKKETLTGAIEQVKADAFEDLAQGSPALALQGRTPGLTVTRTSSRPGDEGVNFLIRGASSINGIEPLIVIDGVPSINSDSFNNMNPNDIENISVLKGGSASVYGSRAAGGVILVTTKKGRGDVKVDISTVLRMGTIGIRPPSPSMSEYGQLYLAAVDEDIATGKPPRYFFWNDRATLQRIANGEEGIYDLPINGTVYLGNAPRFDEMFGNSYSSQHNISVSGGTEKSNFRISAGYDQNVGGLLVADDSVDRYNFSLNYGVDITDRLNISTNVTYFDNIYSGPSGGVDSEAITYDAPLFPTYNPLGQYYANFGGNVGGGKNSIANAIDGGRTNTKNEQFKIAAIATYKITDELNITGSYALSKQHSEDQTYELTVPTYNWFGDIAPSVINPTSFIEEETGTIIYKNYKAALNYSNSFGNHNVSGLIAIEAEKNTSNSLRARRNGFVDYGVYDLDLGATDQQITTEGGGDTWGAFTAILVV